MLFGDLIYRFSLLKRCRDAGRILKGRDKINKLHALFIFKRFVQFLRIDAVISRIKPDKLCSVCAKRVESSDEARIFAYNDIVFITENLAREIKPLLSAGGNYCRIKFPADRKFIAKTRRDLFSETRISLRDTILKSGI
ncbi:hypothetical protein SDC9_163126 [bioreactor metagenome]|uniref:Uncharacterized protein n=1 Tax=bioreactor metagenome TaxID=1076179 RepID=A0A645FPB0_9ZZZZ